MKFGASGDPHLNISNLAVAKKCLALFTELETLADVVIILGDLFHTHAIVRSEILNLWSDYLGNTHKPHILLVGNHDQVAPGSEVNALETFKRYKNVTVVDRPTEINNILFMPFTKDPDIFAKLVKDSKAEYLVCHQTFSGAKYENGLFAPKGFPIEPVQQFKLVISGDVHTQQRFANIWYPGSPYSMTFADTDENKSLWIVDLANNMFTPLTTPLPRHISKTFTDASLVIGWIKTQCVTDRYRVIVKDTRSAIKALLGSKEYIELKSQYSLAIIPKYTDNLFIASKVSDALSPSQMVEKYVQSVMETNLDRPRLTEKALAILKLVGK